MSFWDDRRKEIDYLTKTEGIDNFMDYPTINWTMLTGNAPWLTNEVAALSKDLRWSKFIDEYPESPFAARKEKYGGTNLLGNTLHHAYHLLMLETHLGKQLKDIESIFEVGPGFGSLTRIAFYMGFKGTYYTLDLPELVVLADHYFKHPNIVRLNNPSEIPPSYEVLIATWSLTESHVILRNKVMNSNYKNALIAYSNSFDNMENKRYFENLANTKGGVNLPIEWLEGNQYYIK